VGDAALLVPPKNPQAITRALRRLIQEPDLRRALGAAARRRIEENFTWSAVAGRYLDEYARHIRRPHDWTVSLPAGGGAPLTRDSVLSD
jgi:glycosyltransferase involved in cell wall biosynthesis